ncbi:VCBS repeat-containing protein [Belliella sp. DSM 107340]|uniref:VCBS repeat-containing protein n=1 Tax=Belliella calami TaxID=2923436 RepID=A0ABS9UQJ1_9BACT|nr:VCBS repeat-containing protein [Belliella calami]MCH7398734.1 VCBS repeat-containing protein [Belliella calami]
MSVKTTIAQFNLIILLIFFFSCQEKNDKILLFELLDKSHTGVDFNNELTYTEQLNPYTFRNFYNGGGVALGDINNDGLIDIFLTGNQVGNKLYLNKGNFQFEDITQKAGLEVPGVWSTGVSMADVNGDGLLDIYICKSGPLGGDQRHNELFINNGDMTFSEMSKEYGIADEGLSQHAVFFDFDKDGDLDMYLLNNSARSVGINDLRTGQRDVRDPFGGNKLYRNDNGKFVDVSDEAGIYGSSIGYGLGVTVADINKDGWPDLYVSNDFFEKDYLYLNNGDGTFTESLESMMTEISMGSMGADIADLDNNGWPDVFVTEMLPSDLERIKTKTPFEEWDKYQANVKSGYFHQFTRNTLQRNMGYKPNSEEVHFVEVARQAGVHATDWSWGALIFDVDNDGLRDVFVANGIVKDLTDFDYVDYYVNNQNLISQYKKDSILLTKMIDEFPSNPQQNFLFQNKGDFRFEDIAAASGMGQLTFSTGAAYADLDNDGDLDLVINNLNGEVSIFKNNSNLIHNNNFIQIDLAGNFGAKVSIYSGSEVFYGEHNPVKGYMSSVDHRMHFGLGTIDLIDSLLIQWPNSYATLLKNVQVNQLLVTSPNNAFPVNLTRNEISESPIFTKAKNQIPWKHQESDYVDFDRDRLRFWMISNEGPKIGVGDIDGNGLDDLVLPGARGQATTVWKQTQDGSFKMSQEFTEDQLAEDVEALFFDANGDGYLDVYMASGSIEFGLNNPNYQDRLYINDGNGKFKKSSNQIPPRFESTSFVKAFDHNGDGHLDLLIGGRSIPFAYGLPLDVRLLENDGSGNFKDITNLVAEAFLKIGMTRDAAIADFDGDGDLEIILVGEWMPIRFFKKVNGKYVDLSENFGLSNTGGLWNTIQVLDINNDGKLDFIAGNMGLNTRLKASEEKPMQLHVNDFDQNGSVEQLLTQYEGEGSFPLVLKGPLLKQLPSLRKQLLNYDAYKDKKVENLFPKEILERSVVHEVHTLESKLFLNKDDGVFEAASLPSLVQSSPVYSIYAEKENKDHWEILFGGNQSKIKPEIGINMGSFGWMFRGDDEKKLDLIPVQKSGFFVEGEVRDIKRIRTKQGYKYIVVRNNQSMLILDKQK